MNIRVWVTDVWDNLDLKVSEDHTFAQVKREGLQQALNGAADPGQYEVKFRGALVRDESLTLGAAAVPNGAPMIILPTVRRPVT